VIRTVDAEPARAEARCTEVKGDIEKELGIPLLPENTRKLLRP
jgi:hypothetical protein